MPPDNRFVPRPVNKALASLEQELRPFWRAYGRPVRVHFPVALTRRQIAHDLGVVPDGYLVVQSTSLLTALTPEDWTSDLALLQAADADARAILIFYTLREDPIDV